MKLAERRHKRVVFLAKYFQQIHANTGRFDYNF